MARFASTSRDRFADNKREASNHNGDTQRTNAASLLHRA